MGGLGALRDAFERVARSIGVQITTATDVVSVIADAQAVSGLELADGVEVDADVVIANVDAEHLYGRAAR